MNSADVMDNACSESPSALVITTVHGTWAGEAAWTMRDSPLAAAIRSKAAGPVEVVPFQWSGSNSHRARLHAAGELHSQLEVTLREHPNSRHVIVAHSHGGNVTLNALRDQEVADGISAIVFMATPFLSYAPRCPVPIVMAATATAAMIGCAFFWTLVMSRMLEWISPWILGVQAWWGELLRFGLGLMYVAWLFDCMIKAPLEIVQTLVGPLSDMVRAVQERFAPIVPLSSLKQPVLAASFRSDEAARYLRALQRVTSILPRCVFWSTAAATGALLLAALTYCSALALRGAPTAFGWPEGEQLVLLIPPLSTFLVFAFGFLLACGIAAAIVNFAIGITSRILAIGTVGFGRESLIHQFLVRTEVSVSPENCVNMTERRYTLCSSPGATERYARLSHSLIYCDPNAIEDIAEWIAKPPERAAVSSPVGQLTHLLTELSRVHRVPRPHDDWLQH